MGRARCDVICNMVFLGQWEVEGGESHLVGWYSYL